MENVAIGCLLIILSSILTLTILSCHPISMLEWWDCTRTVLVSVFDTASDSINYFKLRGKFFHCRTVLRNFSITLRR